MKLNKPATTHPTVLPQDIVMNRVLPFLVLPSYTFDGEDDEDFDGAIEAEVEDKDDGRQEEEQGENIHDCCIDKEEEDREQQQRKKRKKAKTIHDEEGGEDNV